MRPVIGLVLIKLLRLTEPPSLFVYTGAAPGGSDAPLIVPYLPVKGNNPGIMPFFKLSTQRRSDPDFLIAARGVQT